MDQTLNPVSRTAEVPVSPLDAFELFTSHISLWWPLELFSIRGADAETCIFELWEGGDIFELAKNSERLRWGRVLEFVPPHHFVASWHPGRNEETAQRLQVSFKPTREGGSEIHLLHDGWEALGDGAAEIREKYDRGWDTVLAPYLKLAREESRRPAGAMPTRPPASLA